MNGNNYSLLHHTTFVACNWNTHSLRWILFIKSFEGNHFQQEQTRKRILPKYYSDIFLKKIQMHSRIFFSITKSFTLNPTKKCLRGHDGFRQFSTLAEMSTVPARMHILWVGDQRKKNGSSFHKTLPFTHSTGSLV